MSWRLPRPLRARPRRRPSSSLSGCDTRPQPCARPTGRATALLGSPSPLAWSLMPSQLPRPPSEGMPRGSRARDGETAVHRRRRSGQGARMQVRPGASASPAVSPHTHLAAPFPASLCSAGSCGAAATAARGAGALRARAAAQHSRCTPTTPPTEPRRGGLRRLHPRLLFRRRRCRRTLSSPQASSPRSSRHA